MEFQNVWCFCEFKSCMRGKIMWLQLSWPKFWTLLLQISCSRGSSFQDCLCSTNLTCNMSWPPLSTQVINIFFSRSLSLSEVPGSYPRTSWTWYRYISHILQISCHFYFHVCLYSPSLSTILRCFFIYLFSHNSFYPTFLKGESELMRSVFYLCVLRTFEEISRFLLN
jgi:hypothetical protein